MIYLDHNATTPLLPAAADAMQPWLREHYGNPSSVHRAGRLARAAIDTARAEVAALLGAQEQQLIFTSGGTEANAMALGGLLARRSGSLLIGATEHAALRDAARALARQGHQLGEIAVDSDGRIDLDDLHRQLKERQPALVSIMWANNETGVVQDMPAIAAAVHDAGALLHCDAVQAAGKLAVDFAGAQIDALSVSAHKIYGPKGVGALLLRRELDWQPLQPGGGQEGGRRGGTENLPGIVGFGVAAQAAARTLPDQVRLGALRDQLEQQLMTLPGIAIYGQGAPRVANTSQFSVAGFESEALLMALDQAGYAVSSGSACHAGNGEPTHVLLAMGVPREQAAAAVRVSLGWQNTAAEVDSFIAALSAIVQPQQSRWAQGLFVA